VPEDEIAGLLGAGDGAAPQALVDAALAARVSDNVTAVTVEYTG
jgi:hypothetical protein